MPAEPVAPRPATPEPEAPQAPVPPASSTPPWKRKKSDAGPVAPPAPTPVEATSPSEPVARPAAPPAEPPDMPPAASTDESFESESVEEPFEPSPPQKMPMDPRRKKAIAIVAAILIVLIAVPFTAPVVMKTVGDNFEGACATQESAAVAGRPKEVAEMLMKAPSGFEPNAKKSANPVGPLTVNRAARWLDEGVGGSAPERKLLGEVGFIRGAADFWVDPNAVYTFSYAAVFELSSEDCAQRLMSKTVEREQKLGNQTEFNVGVPGAAAFTFVDPQLPGVYRHFSFWYVGPYFYIVGSTLHQGDGGIRELTKAQADHAREVVTQLRND